MLPIHYHMLIKGIKDVAIFHFTQSPIKVVTVTERRKCKQTMLVCK